MPATEESTRGSPVEVDRVATNPMPVAIATAIAVVSAFFQAEGSINLRDRPQPLSTLWCGDLYTNDRPGLRIRIIECGMNHSPARDCCERHFIAARNSFYVKLHANGRAPLTHVTSRSNALAVD